MKQAQKGEARLGVITSVYTDQGTVLVDVNMPRPGKMYRKVPFYQLAPGLIVTPAKGEKVVVTHLDDGSRLAMFPQGHPDPTEVTMPVLGEHELCFKFDNESEIRVQNDGSGYTVSISGSSDVSIETQGSATISSTGDVDVTAGGRATVVADDDVTVSGADVNVNATETATVNSGRVQLGGSGGSAVARAGDSVRVYAPEHGWISGQITSGSSTTTSQ